MNKGRRDFAGNPTNAAKNSAAKVSDSEEKKYEFPSEEGRGNGSEWIHTDGVMGAIKIKSMITIKSAASGKSQRRMTTNDNAENAISVDREWTRIDANERREDFAGASDEMEQKSRRGSGGRSSNPRTLALSPWKGARGRRRTETPRRADALPLA